MREDDIIATYFAPLTAGEPGSFLLKDDAAVLTPPAGKQIVVTTDSVIEGVHLLGNATAHHYALKLMRRNLSDLAAMGAAPWRYLLNLRVPAALDAAWFADFTHALKQQQETFGLVLVGGDTTLMGDHIHLTMTVLGLLDGAPLRRHGAKVGDDVYVSGTVGDAALGLALLREGEADAALSARYHAPTPRLELGQALRGVASAALDCSDGLVKDLARLCAASNVGADITRAALPLSDAARHHQVRPDFWSCVLSGGDDYELIFTAPTSQRERIAALATPCARIGSVVAGTAVRVLNEAGNDVTPARTGWEY